MRPLRGESIGMRNMPSERKRNGYEGFAWLMKRATKSEPASARPVHRPHRRAVVLTDKVAISEISFWLCASSSELGGRLYHPRPS